MRNPIKYYNTRGLFWIRIFGKGFAIQNHKKKPLLFSQRMGKKGVVVGKYYLECLN